MQDIRLKEYDQISIELSDSEVAQIHQCLSKRIELSPTADAGRFLLKAGSYVGYMTLPGGRRIIIEPKINIETMFALLAAVYDPNQKIFREDPQSYVTIDGLFEYVVKMYLVHVEHLIMSGILRGYRAIIENTSAIKGKLLIAETIKHSPALRDRHYCKYSYLTPDILENKILRWTSYCLQFEQYREACLADRLRRISYTLSDVELQPSARLLYDRLYFHRLNDTYQPSLLLSRLLMDHLTFGGMAGDEPFLAYLVDMNWLYEKYLSVIIERGVHNLGVEISRNEEHHLDYDRKVVIEPDVILWKDDEPLLVIDAKYKKDEARSDLYQVIAYCHALNINRAALIYPTDDEYTEKRRVSIKGPGDIDIFYLQMDLRGGIKQLDESGKALIKQLEQLYCQ